MVSLADPAQGVPLHPERIVDPADPADRGRRAAVRSEVGANIGGLIVYFGFASPAKGIESLFEIADPQRHRLVLICDLSAEDTYQASILSLASRGDWTGKVTVTGYLPPEQAGRLLAAADAVVFPFLNGGGEWELLHPRRRSAGNVCARHFPGHAGI